jgi:hypothetical protein
MIYQPSDMTHDELAEHAMRVGTATGNDDLRDAGWDLSRAVDREDDSAALGEKVLDLLGGSNHGSAFL